jgi:hypothetical protein
VYIVGNEPDLEWFEGLSPEEYARWFQEVRRYILALDATAMFCSAGIADSNKLTSYLEALRALPERDWPDYVGIHCYAFGHSEPDVEDFLRRLDMQVAVCQTTLPRSTIWLTEFGWLGGTEATEAQGLAFMRLAVAEIRARPIRRAAWWPTKYRGDGELATWLSLIEPETQELTALGREYSRLARRR